MENGTLPCFLRDASHGRGSFERLSPKLQQKYDQMAPQHRGYEIHVCWDCYAGIMKYLNPFFIGVRDNSNQIVDIWIY